MFFRWNDFDRSFAALDDFRQRMDRLMYDYSRLSEEDHWLDTGTAWPRMMLKDEGHQLRIYAEVPGLSDKDLQLSLNHNVLTIAGERRADIPEGYSVHRQERGSYNFSRSFSLPTRVESDGVRASYLDGVLTVTLPKAAEARPKQISVQAGA